MNVGQHSLVSLVGPYPVKPTTNHPGVCSTSDQNHPNSSLDPVSMLVSECLGGSLGVNGQTGIRAAYVGTVSSMSDEVALGVASEEEHENAMGEKISSPSRLPRRDGVGCIAIQPTATAASRTPIPIEASSSGDVETRHRSGSAWVTDGLHHLSSLLHSKTNTKLISDEGNCSEQLMDRSSENSNMSFNSRSARRKLHLSSTGGGGVAVATAWEKDVIAITPHCQQQPQNSPLDTPDATTNEADDIYCGPVSILVPEESRQRLLLGYSSTVLRMGQSRTEVASGSGSPPSETSLALVEHIAFVPRELYIGSISMLGDGSAVTKGSTNGLLWADRAKVRFLQFGIGAMVVLPVVGGSSGGATIQGINLQEEARRQFFERRLQLDDGRSSSPATSNTQDEVGSSTETGSLAQPPHPWWETFAAQLFASPSVVDHHASSNVVSRGGTSNLRRILVDTTPMESGQSGSKPKPMTYFGEWQCGQRHGFGIEVDLTTDGSQGIGSAAAVGGGQSEKVFPLSSGGSTSSTRRSGMLGASHDCPCCSRFRSRGPLFDLTISSHTHQNSSPLFSAKTSAAEPSSCVKYVGPFSMDVREGSGTLYHYPPSLSSSVPSFSVSALWKDGQLMEPGSNMALKFSRRTANKDEMANWRGSVGGGGGIGSTANRTRVLQSSNATPMEVRLLDSGYVLNGTNWDFDTLEFDSLSLTPPPTSLAMIPKSSFAGAPVNYSAQSPTTATRGGSTATPPPLTPQEQEQRDLVVATTAAATVFAASSTLSRSTVHANIPRHTDGLWEGLFADLDSHLSSTTTEMLRTTISTAASPTDPNSLLVPSKPSAGNVPGASLPRGAIAHDVWVSSPRARLWSAMMSVVDRGPFQTMLCSFQQLLMTAHPTATGTLEDPPSLADPLRLASAVKYARISCGTSDLSTPSLSAWSSLFPTNMCPAAGGTEVAAVPSHKALAAVADAVSSAVLFPAEHGDAAVPPSVLTPPFLNQHAPPLPRPGGASSLRQPPPAVTSSMFLRSCDDVTSFVASMRFRLMSVLAANPTLPSLLSANVTVKAHDGSQRGASASDTVAHLLGMLDGRRTSPTHTNSAKGDTPVASLLNHILDELDGSSVEEAHSGAGSPLLDETNNNQEPHSPLSAASTESASSMTGFRARKQHLQQRPRGQSMSTLMNASSLDVADEVLYFTWDYVFPIVAPVLDDTCRQLSDVKCWAADVALTVQRLERDPLRSTKHLGLKPASASSPKINNQEAGLNKDAEHCFPDAQVEPSGGNTSDCVPPTSRAYMLLEANYSRLLSHIASKAFGTASSGNTSTPLNRAATKALSAIFLHRNSTSYVTADSTTTPQPSTVNSTKRVTNNGTLLFSPLKQLDSHTRVNVCLNDCSSSSQGIPDRAGNDGGEVPSDAAPSLSSLLVAMHELYAAVTDECLRAATKHYSTTIGKKIRRDCSTSRTASEANARGDAAAKMLVCREWTAYLVRGAMPLVCSHLIQRAAELHDVSSGAFHSHSSNLDVYAASEAFVARIVTLQEVVRKGLLASVTASAGTSLACAYSTKNSSSIPHVHKYEGSITGASSPSSPTITLGLNYAYDQPVSTSIVSVYMEALEVLRGRCAEDNAGNMKAFLPQLPQPVASSVSAVAIGSPVVSALLSVKAEAESTLQVQRAASTFLQNDNGTPPQLKTVGAVKGGVVKQQGLSVIASSVLEYTRAFNIYTRGLMAAKLLVDPLLPSSTQLGSFAGSPMAKLCEQEGSHCPPGGRAPSQAASSSLRPGQLSAPPSTTILSSSSGYAQTALDLANALIQEDMGWQEAANRRYWLETGGGSSGESGTCFSSEIPTLSISGAVGLLSPTESRPSTRVAPPISRAQLMERIVHVIATALHQQHHDQAVIGNQHCNNTGVAADTVSCSAPQWMSPFVPELQPLPVFINTLIMTPPVESIESIIRMSKKEVDALLSAKGEQSPTDNTDAIQENVEGFENALRRLLSQEPSQLLSVDTYRKRVERLLAISYPVLVELLLQYAQEPSPHTIKAASHQSPTKRSSSSMDIEGLISGKVSAFLGALDTLVDVPPLRPNALLTASSLSVSTLWKAMGLLTHPVGQMATNRRSRSTNLTTAAGYQFTMEPPILPADSFVPSSSTSTHDNHSAGRTYVSAEATRKAKRHDLSAEAGQDYVPVIVVEAVHDQLCPRLRSFTCTSTQSVNTFLSTLRWQTSISAAMSHIHLVIPGAPSPLPTNISSSLSSCLISSGTHHTDLTSWSIACASISSIGPTRGLPTLSSAVTSGRWGAAFHHFALRAKKKLKALRPAAKRALLKKIQAMDDSSSIEGAERRTPARLMFEYLLGLELQNSSMDTFLLRGPATFLKSQLVSNLASQATSSFCTAPVPVSHQHQPCSHHPSTQSDSYRRGIYHSIPSFLVRKAGVNPNVDTMGGGGACLAFGAGSSTSARFATIDRSLRVLLGVGLRLDADSSAELGSVGQTLPLIFKGETGASRVAQSGTLQTNNEPVSLESRRKDTSSSGSDDDTGKLGGAGSVEGASLLRQLQVIKLQVVDVINGPPNCRSRIEGCGGYSQQPCALSAALGLLDRATAKAFANALLDGVQRDNIDRREGVDVGGGSGGR